MASPGCGPGSGASPNRRPLTPVKSSMSQAFIRERTYGIGGLSSPSTGDQRQVQPGQADIPFHVAGAVAAGRIVKDREFAADFEDRRQTDAFVAPGTILSVQRHRLVVWIPKVQIFRPINPNGVGELVALLDPDVVREQKPGLIRRFEVERRVFDLRR